MNVVHEEQDWRVVLLKPGEQVDLRGRPVVTEVMLTECYILPEGDINDNPSVCFVAKTREGKEIVAQISERMLQPMINELKELVEWQRKVRSE